MTLAAVGASLWASGSQVWKGITGSLMPKPMMRNVKIAATGITVSCSGAIWLSWIMSKVPAEKPSVRMPISIAAEPENVNSTYFQAEYCLRPVPQMEIRKYMGTSSISQKMKKRMKSSAVNTPSRLVSSTSNQTKYSLGRRSTRQEMSTAISERNAVSTSIASERPSAPSRYCTLKVATSESI